jgi:hypothetical protein
MLINYCPVCGEKLVWNNLIFIGYNE